MAHFAQLDENNVVIQVIVISNEDVLDKNGEENEEAGIKFCQSLFGESSVWKQTSYTTSGGKRFDPETNQIIAGTPGFRGNYASVGYKYNETLDAFLPPKPYPSWIIDTENYIWIPPIPYPEINDKGYNWNEEQLTWEIKAGPYPSWIWNEEIPRWEPPVPYPNDDLEYTWDEETINWKIST